MKIAQNGQITILIAQVMFLNYKTSDGHRMQTAYCGLQKSLRNGSEDKALYWAGQIGKSMRGAKGYPNALKKRLCQNALEDAASWTFASRLLEELPSGPKLEFEQLIPWVIGLAQLSKTHSTAWLNRVAAQRVYDGFISSDQDINVHSMNEVEFAAACLQAHSVGNIDALRSACLGDGDVAIKLYKFVNADPLVLHAWQMHQRRPELRDRVISVSLTPPNNVLSTAVFETRQELPLEWFDKHTKEGKKMGRGYAHFFAIMELHPRAYDREEGVDGVTANACVRGGADPYESEAKDLYLDFKLDGCEARVRHLLDPSLLKRSSNKKAKKRTSREGEDGDDDDEDTKADGAEKERGSTLAAKKQKQQGGQEQEQEEVDHSSSVSSTAVTCHGASSDVLKDTEVFQIPERTGLIGFKNFTVVGVLKAPLQGVELLVGDRVFVKMGEAYETCMFALACDDMRGQLGMVSMRGNMTVEWLLPSYDVAELVSRTNPLWVSAVTKRMNKARQVLSNSAGALPAILMGVFEGHDLCHRKEWLTDGMELLKVLLFRKYVGAADTNGKNMMVNESGLVFSVDETVASADQLVRSRSKGLVTAQSIHVVLLDKAAQALCERPVEVATFIEQLKQLPLPAIVSHGDRLSVIHSDVPFNEGTMALLLTTEFPRRSLEALAKMLKLK